MPSTVVMLALWQLSSGRKHELTDTVFGLGELPSTNDMTTVHTPHPPWPQFFFVPFRLGWARINSLRVVYGSGFVCGDGRVTKKARLPAATTHHSVRLAVDGERDNIGGRRHGCYSCSRRVTVSKTAGSRIAQIAPAPGRHPHLPLQPFWAPRNLGVFHSRRLASSSGRGRINRCSSTHWITQLMLSNGSRSADTFL